MSKPPPRVFSYVRFSHPRQSLGGGLQRQLDMTRGWCERKGLQLDDGLTLQDLGVSAFRGDNVRNGALAGFLEACRTGRVPRGSYLAVESLDRLSRDEIRPALQLFLGLQDYGIHIVTLQPEREYSPDNSDALALIEPLIVFARAHEESVMKSHRRGKAWQKRKDEARAGGRPVIRTCPLWLEPDEAGGFRLIEERAATVRLIFELSGQGMGVYSIVRRLTDDEVPAFGYSGKWNINYVHEILSGPAAMGGFQPGRQEGKHVVADGEVIPNYFPAAISEQQWRRAQEDLEARRDPRAAGRKSREVNLFRGIVFNAETGEPMGIQYALGRKEIQPRRRYTYLSCTRTSRVARKAGSARLDFAAFECGVLRHLSELRPADLDPPGRKRTADAVDAEMGDLSARLVDIDSKLTRATARARGAGDFDLYLDLIEQLQQDRRQVAERLAALEGQRSVGAIDLGETRSLIGLLANARGKERQETRRRLRNRIAALVREIWVLILGDSPRYAHVQLHMRHGAVRTFTVFHRAPTVGVEPLPEGTDLRTWAGRK
jgi:DNA invertase Pin-like site-specific DNA recombinase